MPTPSTTNPYLTHNQIPAVVNHSPLPKNTVTGVADPKVRAGKKLTLRCLKEGTVKS
jgi:hypothetical protein